MYLFINKCTFIFANETLLKLKCLFHRGDALNEVFFSFNQYLINSIYAVFPVFKKK